MSEGLADFLGLWDIDKTTEENISSMPNSVAYKVAEATQVGSNNKASKWHWMTAKEFFSNGGPAGSMVYQQGWWFYLAGVRYIVDHRRMSYTYHYYL